MDQDGIDLAVLYPTMLLGLQSKRDVDFAEAQARAYNDWCSDHTLEGEGRLFGAGAVPPMHDADDVARVAAEIRRVAELPGMVSVFMRPNPSVDWRPFNDPVYDPVWQAAADTGLPIALHPFLAADLPGACVGLRLGRPRDATGHYQDDFDPERTMSLEDQLDAPAHAAVGALHTGHRQPGRRDELDRVPHRRAASASASPTPSSSSSRPTAAGWCRGSNGSTTTAASSSGRCRTSRCSRPTT